MTWTHLDGVLLVAEVDEREAARPSRLVVVDDLELVDRSVTREDVAQVALLRVEAQAEDTEAAARLRVVLKQGQRSTAQRGRRGGEVDARLAPRGRLRS